MDNPQSPNNSPDWERKTLEKLVYSALDEQKSRRRWGIFFKILGFAYLTAVLATKFHFGLGWDFWLVVVLSILIGAGLAAAGTAVICVLAIQAMAEWREQEGRRRVD